jgi:hypothetical protein
VAITFDSLTSRDASLIPNPPKTVLDILNIGTREYYQVTELVAQLPGVDETKMVVLCGSGGVTVGAALQVLQPKIKGFVWIFGLPGGFDSFFFIGKYPKDFIDYAMDFDLENFNHKMVFKTGF